MKRILFIVSLLSASLTMSAQQAEVFRLETEVRIDYMQEYQEGNAQDAVSGFQGKSFNFRIDGQIADGLTYSWRQRVNRPGKNDSFFDATDWATINYSLDRWTFSGGKQVVAIGGYEYDMSPINCYFSSEYWHNIGCYQFGASASYALGSKEDKLMFQFCESPFRRNALNVTGKEMFAYNLMWTGRHGFFSTISSVNMIEYLPGKFINYIALGSRFEGDQVALELDVMNRAVNAKDFWGKDMSVMADFSWYPSDRLRLFAKVTYDFNRCEEIGDFGVLPGTDVVRAGVGLEFYPLKNMKNLRLHLNGCYTDGKCVEGGALRPHQTIIDGGVTWRMKIINLKR